MLRAHFSLTAQPAVYTDSFMFLTSSKGILSQACNPSILAFGRQPASFPLVVYALRRRFDRRSPLGGLQALTGAGSEFKRLATELLKHPEHDRRAAPPRRPAPAALRRRSPPGC